MDKLDVTLMPDLSAGEVLRWLDSDISKDSQSDIFAFLSTPTPEHLCSLAGFAHALVLSDGLVLMNGPESCRRAVPEWGLKGYCYVYSTLEDLLCGGFEDTDSILCRSPESFQDLYRGCCKNSLSSGLGIELNNYLAWECLSVYRPFQIKLMRSDDLAKEMDSAALVLDIGKILSRVLVESLRRPLEDLNTCILPTTALSTDAFQIPLVLPAALARIDLAEHLIEELHHMRDEMTNTRRYLGEIREIACQPNLAGADSNLALLVSDVQREIRKHIGNELACSSGFEMVPGIADALDCTGFNPGMGNSLRGKTSQLFGEPEIRFISGWPEESAVGTISRIRSLFRTDGTDDAWALVSRVLQQRGSIAWYPFRGMFG